MYRRSLLVAAALCTAAGNAQVRFNRDIRPIMAETCFRCHGPDKSSRMAGDAAGHSRRGAESRTAMASRRSCPAIPTRARSSSASSTTARASCRRHSRTRSCPPRRRRPSGAGSRKARSTKATGPISRCSARPFRADGNPIDAFIRERLAREGLKPSPEADRRTLIRRVTLDLTGMPPTPEEVAAFQKDASPRRLRKAGGPPDGLAALRRAADHALARRGALRRYLRLPWRQRLPRLAVSRLRAARLPRQQAVRRIHARTTGRRPDAERHRWNSGWRRPTTA